jgi:predicted acylesterase/phospholipase RssA
MSGVELRFTAVDLETGTLKIYDQADLALHGLKPVLATSSFPCFFPPVEIEDRYETDGGVTEIAPLASVIDAGCDHILVLPTRDPYQMEPVDRERFQRFPGDLALAKRVIDIQSHDVLRNDLRVCHQVNHWLDKGWLSPETGRRRIELDVIYPSKPLGDSLDFTGSIMDRQIDQGYEDARSHYE